VSGCVVRKPWNKRALENIIFLRDISRVEVSREKENYGIPREYVPQTPMNSGITTGRGAGLAS
jgi:hypothetical protein